MHHKYIVKTTSRDGIATLINDVIFYYAKKRALYNRYTPL